MGNFCYTSWGTRSEHVCALAPHRSGMHRCVCGDYSTSGTARQTVPDDGPGPTPPPGPSSPPDGGVGAPPGPHDPGTAGLVAPTPPSPEITAFMQIERCRVLLAQWRRDRLSYPTDYPAGLVAIAIKACEDQLREALGDQI